MIRKAPKKELERLQELVVEYESKILNHYANSKKNVVSGTETEVEIVLKSWLNTEYDSKQAFKHDSSKVSTNLLGLSANIPLKDRGSSNIAPVEELKSKVLQTSQISFLMIPNEAVKDLVDNDKQLRGFGSQCLLLPYSIDLMIGSNAIEVNGPYHYIHDYSETSKNQNAVRKMNGYTSLKKELIEFVGMKYVELPYWEIDPILESVRSGKSNGQALI